MVVQGYLVRGEPWRGSIPSHIRWILCKVHWALALSLQGKALKHQGSGRKAAGPAGWGPEGCFFLPWSWHSSMKPQVPRTPALEGQQEKLPRMQQAKMEPWALPALSIPLLLLGTHPSPHTGGDFNPHFSEVCWLRPLPYLFLPALLPQGGSWGQGRGRRAAISGRLSPSLALHLGTLFQRDHGSRS